jgi:CheY-like chemotaxis protein
MPRTTLASLPGRAGEPAGSRILVVDDELPIRELVAQVLEDEGYLVEQAANGREALLKVQLMRPDVIVLDVMMPVMDGWTFAQACHSLFGEPIPILLLSASAQLARATEQLRVYGVHASLAKPFDLDALLTLVGRLRGARAASCDACPGE